MKRLLLIESDPFLAMMLLKRFRRERFDVRHASHAEEAWRFIAMEQPDAILAGLVLPRKDGFEFLQELRAHPTAAAGVRVAAHTRLEREKTSNGVVVATLMPILLSLIIRLMKSSHRYDGPGRMSQFLFLNLVLCRSSSFQKTATRFYHSRRTYCPRDLWCFCHSRRFIVEQCPCPHA